MSWRAAVLLSSLACSLAAAQTLEILYSFSGADGAYPVAGLTLGDDGAFYGTTGAAGTFGKGNVFRITTNGVLTTLVSFNNTNGSMPRDLTKYGVGSFYGTTVSGGLYNKGTVFRVTAGGELTTLVNFNTTNGAVPQSGLTLGQDGNFYGTASGGSTNSATFFRMTPDGDLTTLATFPSAYGAGPRHATLVQSPAGELYGTTMSGGPADAGTVFKVTTNGVLTLLHTFTGGADGGNPLASLVQGADGNFYGTAQVGGDFDAGTVFSITTNGVLSTLVSFAGTNGATPQTGLTRGDDGALYGGTELGGPGYADGVGTGYGTVFKLTTNGGFSMLAAFAYTNGFGPVSGLAFGPDGELYGTIEDGGNGQSGEVFRLRLLPQLQAPGFSQTNGLSLLATGLNNQSPAIWEASGNLLDWWPAQTNVPVNGQASFQDLSITNQSFLFYRVRQPFGD